MAASKSTRRRSRPAQSKPHLPERIADRIESERRRLNKAVAVLIGAELTAEYCPDLDLVTDAISVAGDLISQAVDALDRVELRRP
jgi:hypothetical protein